ncbi:MAG: hypothetical protein LBQ57_08075, partial [Spirochaetales bacterium]|nr:hypothetical protein [Spirochaetales bacterium]
MIQAKVSLCGTRVYFSLFITALLPNEWYVNRLQHIEGAASSRETQKKNRVGCTNFFRAKSPEALGPRQGLQRKSFWRSQKIEAESPVFC